MEAAVEGAVGLSEARDGSPLSGATASEDGDTVLGMSYGMDPGDMGTCFISQKDQYIISVISLP